jgi:hypothetical protein
LSISVIGRVADASEFLRVGPAAPQVDLTNVMLLMKLNALKLIFRREAIWLLRLLLAAATKFADLVNGKVEGSRLDNKIQSTRSPWSAPIDEGLTRQMS